jgi:hypothetical protein
VQVLRAGVGLDAEFPVQGDAQPLVGQQGAGSLNRIGWSLREPSYPNSSLRTPRARGETASSG